MLLHNHAVDLAYCLGAIFRYILHKPSRKQKYTVVIALVFVFEIPLPQLDWDGYLAMGKGSD